MARKWLKVTTDEVHSRLNDDERLAERRETIAAKAYELLEAEVTPAFQAAGQRLADREYRESGHTDWAVARCGIYAPGSVEIDPTVAFHEAEFDAYQPLVILRRKAHGAGASVHATTVRLDKLDRALLDDFLSQ